MSSTKQDRGTDDPGTSVAEKGLSTASHLQQANASPQLPQAWVRKQRVIISGSQEKTNNALAFVMAGVQKLESELWFAAQNGDAINWYVERDGLEQMALNEGNPRDHYVQQVYQLVGTAVTDAQRARTLQGIPASTPHVDVRLVWITKAADLIGDLNQLPLGSVRSISIFSHGTKDEINLRYYPGEPGVLTLTDQDVRRLYSKIFVPESQVPFVYIGACRIGSVELIWGDVDAMAQRMADTLRLPVYAWTGRTSYTNVPGGGREGPSTIVWYARGGRYTGPRIDWAEAWRRASTPTLSDPAIKRFDPR